MNENKYIAVYYPNSWIKNRNSLATFCLFFDEVHLVTQSDMAKDPTTYLKNLSDKIQIGVLGKLNEDLLKKVAGFYQFAMDNRALLKNVIY
jgi:hypothetical protein